MTENNGKIGNAAADLHGRLRIAVAADNGLVSGHFGHCRSFIIYDVEDGRVKGSEEVPNPEHQPGFLPGFLAERRVDMVLAGGMGPRAVDLFAARNIRTISGVQGPVLEAVEKLLKGDLELGVDTCDHDHGHERHGGHEGAHCRDGHDGECGGPGRGQAGGPKG